MEMGRRIWVVEADAVPKARLPFCGETTGIGLVPPLLPPPTPVTVDGACWVHALKLVWEEAASIEGGGGGRPYFSRR